MWHLNSKKKIVIEQKITDQLVYYLLFQKQTISYADQFLSNFLCGYRKGYSTQTAFFQWFKNRNIYLIKKDMQVQ